MNIIYFHFFKFFLKLYITIMILQIDLLTFKNILNKNSIQLFDTQMRIAHFRYNQYINSMPQIGGSNLKKSSKLLININQKNNCLLSHFIDSLVSNNLTKTKFIIDNLLID
jgi:hypothetical protein